MHCSEASEPNETPPDAPVWRGSAAAIQPFAQMLYPPRSSIRVDWDDPRTIRNQYSTWYSHSPSKPHPQSRDGFMFFDGEKLYKVAFSPKYDYPNYKHIIPMGILDQDYKFSWQWEECARNCTISLKREEEELRYTESCNGNKGHPVRFYSYSD